jgi:excisionase family DNA binding protein
VFEVELRPWSGGDTATLSGAIGLWTDASAIVSVHCTTLASCGVSVQLLDLKAAARRLCVSPEHVRALVDDGRLPFINIGRGAKRPRYRFADADLSKFIEANRQREEACQFSNSKTVGPRSGNTISNSVVVGFMDQRNARLAAKQKNSKP